MNYQYTFYYCYLIINYGTFIAITLFLANNMFHYPKPTTSITFLMIEEVRICETFISFNETARRYISEDCHL
jgi:hypothetical protein